MEMPTHTRKCQSKQWGTCIPLQPLNSSISFYYTGNTFRSKLITQTVDFSTEIDTSASLATFTVVKMFVQTVGRRLGNIFFVCLFKTPQPYQGMICFFNLPIWVPLAGWSDNAGFFHGAKCRKFQSFKSEGWNITLYLWFNWMYDLPSPGFIYGDFFGKASCLQCQKIILT